MQFEQDHVLWREPPTIEEGVLAFTARYLAPESQIFDAFDIYLDPLEGSLSLNELFRLETYCRGGGQSLICRGPAIHVLDPPGEGFIYVDLEPEDVVASEWRIVQNHLIVQVDISQLATEAGIYTLILWDSEGLEPIAEYSLIYDPKDDPLPAPTPTPTPAPVGERATWDRPDDFEGPQIHFVYAVPSDAADLQRDTNGAIERSISAVQYWMRSESGGQEFRIDTFDGEPDITFLPLTVTQFQVFNDPRSSWAQIGDELLRRGFPTQDRVYAVYYVGFSDPGACGLGGTMGELQLAVTLLGRGCPAALASSETKMENADYTVIHEIFHALGAVPECAPNSTARDGNIGHVDDFLNDVLWGGDAPQYLDQSQSLDLGRDDYFGHDNEDCLDLQDSPFLTVPTP